MCHTVESASVESPSVLSINISSAFSCCFASDPPSPHARMMQLYALSVAKLCSPPSASANSCAVAEVLFGSVGRSSLVYSELCSLAMRMRLTNTSYDTPVSRHACALRVHILPTPTPHNANQPGATSSGSTVRHPLLSHRLQCRKPATCAL
jgi:hypothetical protein